MNLQKEMTDAVKRLVRDGFMDDRNQKQKSRILWILNHKSQAVLTGNQIIWSHETQEAIKESSMKGDSLYVWYEILIKQLKNLTEQIQSGFKDPIYHKISVALITADVHNRDVVMNLISNEVESIHDFTWQQQLKYSI
jgi:dynein heavy chain